MTRGVTKVELQGKLDKLSDMLGLKFHAQYYNGFCHIAYDLPNGGVEGVAVGTKREMYDFAYAMIMGVRLYEKNK